MKKYLKKNWLMYLFWLILWVAMLPATFLIIDYGRYVILEGVILLLLIVLFFVVDYLRGEKTFKIKDIEVYDLIIESPYKWYIVESTNKDHDHVGVMDMTNDLRSIFDQGCIKEGMTIVKYSRYNKLGLPLVKEETK